MKEVAFIFLFFSFGVLSVFGQSVASGNRHPQSDFRAEKVVNGHLLAQGLAEQEAAPQASTESRPPTQEDSTEHTDAAPISEEGPNTPTPQTEVANAENGETVAEPDIQWEKTRRIFTVVNDYKLAADEVLTSLVMIAGNARLEGSVIGNVLVLGGNVELTSSAQVNGTLHVIGGTVTGNIENIENLQVSHHWQMIPAAVKLVMHPRTLWEIRKETDLRLMLVKFVLFLSDVSVGGDNIFETDKCC